MIVGQVELCACFVAYIDCQWNCVRVQQFIVIVGAILCVLISS
jgi:hypothetical protein